MTSASGAHAVVLYDRDCGFCRWSVAMLLRADTAARLRPVAIQSAEGGRLLSAVPAGERLASAHTIDPAGRRHSGGAWLAAALDELPRGRAPAAVLRAAHRPVDAAYGWIARHRSVVSRLVPSTAKGAAQSRIDRHGRRFTAPDRHGAPAHATR